MKFYYKSFFITTAHWFTELLDLYGQKAATYFLMIPVSIPFSESQFEKKPTISKQPEQIKKPFKTERIHCIKTIYYYQYFSK